MNEELSLVCCVMTCHGCSFHSIHFLSPMTVHSGRKYVCTVYCYVMCMCTVYVDGETSSDSGLLIPKQEQDTYLLLYGVNGTGSIHCIHKAVDI